MSFLQQLTLIVLLILISIFFSISEIALTAARKIKIRQLADDGNPKAISVLALQEKPGYFFSVIQIGVNLVAIIGGIVGESTFTIHYSNLISLIYTGEHLNAISISLSVLTITTLFILFADLIPKQIAIVYPEIIALKVIRPMQFCIYIFKPLVLFFSGISALFFKLFNIPTVSTDEITQEDIVAMVAAGARMGAVAAQEHHLIENVFELEARSVGTSMTLRDDIIWIEHTATEDDIRKVVATHSHSRYLICNQTIDQVIGYIDVKDVLKKVLENQALSLKKDCLLKTALLIPDTLSLSESLKMFKSFNDDFAVILNEYSIVTGIITLNDVMATVMGNSVASEEDPQIIARDENSWLIEGATPIEDVEKALNIASFPNSEVYETIAGFMMYVLRKIPRATDFAILEGYKFEVVDVDNNKIDQLLVSRLPIEPVPEDISA